MIVGMLWLLGCQLVGEVVARGLDLPVPGPVIGLALLLVVLRVRRPEPDAAVLRAGGVLLRHLQLFFVPAGVGIVVHLDLVRDHALPLVGGLVVSWAAGLLAVAGLVVLLSPRRRRGDPPVGGGRTAGEAA